MRKLVAPHLLNLFVMKKFAALVAAALLLVHFCRDAKAGHNYRFKRMPHSPRKRSTTWPPTTTASTTQATDLSSGDYIINNSTLLENQCASGTNSSFSSSENAIAAAVSGDLYVDIGQPAPCSGTIARWEMCFLSNGDGLNRSIHFVIIKNIGESYRIKSVHERHFHIESKCDYIEAQDERIVIERGDCFGFISRDNSQVALARVENSTLRMIDYSENGNMFPGVGATLRFEEVTPEPYVALFRAVISK